jgi:HEAT repeat protein
MLDVTSKKLLRLLAVDHASELRCAAARVMGELGVKDPEVADSLCKLIGDADPAVRLQALAALGKLRIEQALPQLLKKVSEGGLEAEIAAQAAAHLGPRGTKSLQELMSQVAPGLRRRIAGALASRP